jgi:hypothetical protein
MTVPSSCWTWNEKNQFDPSKPAGVQGGNKLEISSAALIMWGRWGEEYEILQQEAV